MSTQTDTAPILSQTVEVFLRGKKRTCLIERHTAQHCWFTKTPIICRFFTGNKNHTVNQPQVVERNGQWVFPSQSVHNRHINPSVFADEIQGNSGWTSNVAAVSK